MDDEQAFEPEKMMAGNNNEPDAALTDGKKILYMKNPPGTKTAAGKVTDKILTAIIICGIILFGIFFIDRWINREKYDQKIKKKEKQEYEQREAKRQKKYQE